MSSGLVVPDQGAYIHGCHSDSLRTTTTNADDRPPSTGAYRSQQFLDITDDLEGLPSYHENIVDYFTVAQNIRHPHSSHLTKTHDLADRFLYVQTDQHTGTGDFILFQGEAPETNSSDDMDISDTSSSAVSCCSDFSLYDSTKSCGPIAASAFLENLEPIAVEASVSEADGPPEIVKEINLCRLLRWLQSVPLASDIAAPCMGNQCEPGTFSVFGYADEKADSHSQAHWFCSYCVQAYSHALHAKQSVKQS